MSENRWLATGNFFTAYRDEQRIFRTHLDRLIFTCFLALLFVWPLFFELSNKYMLVIDSILIAIVAVYGLNLLTGFAGLISIGHAAFVGVGAYTLASFSRVLGDSHVLLTHGWPLMILIAGGVGAVFGAIVGLPSLRLKHLYLVIATLATRVSASRPRPADGDLGSAPRPQLTSLVDLMVILLVFLLKSFSVEGQLVTPATDLQLPTSQVREVARPALSVEVTTAGIRLQL